MDGLNFIIADRLGDGGQFLLDRINQWGLAWPVNISVSDWATLWDDLKEMVFRGQVIDLAEIGSSWLGNLVGMNALRPFTSSEAARFGGASAFLPAAWSSVRMPGDTRVWAIPWTVDVRVIYYWRDMLEVAEIDPATAFTSPEQIETTLWRLQQIGIESPWSTITTRMMNTVHHLTSWIWSVGGDYLSEDGRRTRFAEPETLEAIASYFRLIHYAPPFTEPVDEVPGVEGFCDRHSAVLMSGPWVIHRIRQKYPNEWYNHLLGVASPPGAAFVGGSHLVIFQNAPARHERMIFDLLARVTSKTAQIQFSGDAGVLPARLDSLNALVQAEAPYIQEFVQVLKDGRSIPPALRWGVIEDRLADAFAEIWQVILADPNVDILALVQDRLIPLAARLDRTLAS